MSAPNRFDAADRLDAADRFGPVAILGPGLIGGSLGLSLRRSGADIRFWARRAEALEPLRALGFAADTNLPAVVRGAKTIVLCTPVESMQEQALQFRDALSPTTLVTDAGSVKGPVVEALQSLLGSQFVGAHPIAGSDRSGLDAARADLYEAATCVLTPTSVTSPTALENAHRFWQAAGCRTLEMDPAAHDAALARTSHLPHAVASALVQTIAATTPHWEELAGGGYRDSTRIAAGHAGMWTGILLANRTEVSTSIAELIGILQNIRAALETSDAEGLHALLADAKAIREKFDAV